MRVTFISRLRRTGVRANQSLQNRAEQHAGGAPDKVVPEIADVKPKVEDDDQRLRRQRSPKDSGAADASQEKPNHKQAQHHRVKNGADDIDGLNQVLRQRGREGETDGD